MLAVSGAVLPLRDIKPGNLLVAADGTCKIADFGTSIPTLRGLIRNTDVRGTPAFMAPELFSQSLPDMYDGFATDVYSLGTTPLHTRLVVVDDDAHNRVPIDRQARRCTRWSWAHRLSWRRTS